MDSKPIGETRAVQDIRFKCETIRLKAGVRGSGKISPNFAAETLRSVKAFWNKGRSLKTIPTGFNTARPPGNEFQPHVWSLIGQNA
jgi:hypothetical protein